MKAILRVLAAVGRWAHNKLNAIEERDAVAASLPKGIVVTLSKCRCPYKEAHEGLWVIDRYNVDANDYRIIRVEDGKADYAKREAMEVIEANRNFIGVGADYRPTT